MSINSLDVKCFLSSLCIPFLCYMWPGERKNPVKEKKTMNEKKPAHCAIYENRDKTGNRYTNVELWGRKKNEKDRLLDSQATERKRDVFMLLLMSPYTIMLRKFTRVLVQLGSRQRQLGMRGLSRKESRTLSAEIQTEIQKSKSTEIEKSILKSRNPIWNPEIHSEIQKSNSVKSRFYYPYTLH